ncbi:hypothetical protein K402DRAFT_333109 [Aulographum hederae CBS 113979]|uniref:Uncharacterized protein n=1 Tax=Aulographum hederae CBS 113979 TaxID=1176131 RepID=A0A6G1GZM6_9PEZI|nr:hypothetical protein K402DRAFT_333109 [Aulographum hederae CBS 113979]
MAASASTRVAVKSPHVSDASLQPFLADSFDPADYLNSVLPSLSTSSNQNQNSRPQNLPSVPLGDLSSRTQSLLSQLNAQTTHLSTILTQLTDDILRSGGRLAYEVEVLRGEAIGLSESFNDTLQVDIKRFNPSGISTLPISPIAEDGSVRSPSIAAPPVVSQAPTPKPSSQPPDLTHLQTLTLVRARLDKVISTFGSALNWPLPPSELSHGIPSSIISVSAPSDSTAGNDSQAREAKGKEFMDKTRSEISDLLASGHIDDGSEGDKYATAQAKIEELRDLAGVWKGTAEEKARLRFVESLVKLAEEKQRARRGDDTAPSRSETPKRGMAAASRPSTEERSRGGVWDGLRGLRDNIYME